MRTVKRLGALGCGGHGRLSHFTAFEGAVLTAVYDPSQASIDETQKLVGGGLTVCKTPEELLALDLDGVLVMTPDETHPDLLDMVVRAGFPVLCEKPLAIDAEGLVKVHGALAHAQANGRLVASCHPRRDRHHSDLPYGWVKVNLVRLIGRYGSLTRIGLNSIYPQPQMAWKNDRSFLLDKFVHDIDYLRFLLGDLPFQAERIADGHDHYEVTGAIGVPGGRAVAFGCAGTRLHTARGEFIEVITLTFTHGECTVFTKTGTVRLRDRRTGAVETVGITKMDDDGYDRIFNGIMRDFVDALDGGAPRHTPEDLLVVTGSAVELAAPRGMYSYAGM